MDPKNLLTLRKGQQSNDYILDWATYFRTSGKKGGTENTITQLYRFKQAIDGLTQKDWVIPQVRSHYMI